MNLSLVFLRCLIGLFLAFPFFSYGMTSNLFNWLHRFFNALVVLLFCKHSSVWFFLLVVSFDRLDPFFILWLLADLSRVFISKIILVYTSFKHLRFPSFCQTNFSTRACDSPYSWRMRVLNNLFCLFVFYRYIYTWYYQRHRRPCEQVSTHQCRAKQDWRVILVICFSLICVHR